MREIEDTALAFDRACRAAGVGYVLVGGFAVLAWGQPRTTMDVDALVALSPHDVEGFVRALRRETLEVDAGDFADAFRDRSHVTVHDLQGPFHVDVALARSAEERNEVERGREVPYGEGRLRVAAPEETIAFKLKFGSPQDLQDVRSILVRQEDRLDRGRLRGLAARLGVEAALERAIEDARE